MDEGVLMLKKKPVKLALRFLLCGKALDDADTGEVLVDIRRNIGRFFPERLPSLVCDDLNKIHADSDQRQHENRTLGESDVFDHHDHQNGDDRENVRNQLCDTVVQHIL